MCCINASDWVAISRMMIGIKLFIFLRTNVHQGYFVRCDYLMRMISHKKYP